MSFHCSELQKELALSADNSKYSSLCEPVETNSAAAKERAEPIYE